MADGMTLPYVITNYCIVDKRTPSLRGEVLGAGTTGPAVYRCGRSIGHFWALCGIYNGYILSGSSVVIVDVSCELLRC